MPDTGSEHHEDQFAALRQAEAAFRLAPSERSRQAIVASAVGLLLLGFDTASLRILAGEDAADMREVAKYLGATLAELGLVPLDDRAAVLGLLDSIATDFIDGRLDPRTAARRLWATWSPRSWDLDLGPEATTLAITADGVADLWGERYAPTVGDLRRAAKSYLDRDSARPSGDMNERLSHDRAADVRRMLTDLRARFGGLARRLLGTRFPDYGCEYCADDGNRLYGHVTQVATDDERGFILLRCPRCGALYENTAGGFDETRRLTESEARRGFPTWSPSEDIPVR